MQPDPMTMIAEAECGVQELEDMVPKAQAFAGSKALNFCQALCALLAVRGPDRVNFSQL